MTTETSNAKPNIATKIETSLTEAAAVKPPTAAPAVAVAASASAAKPAANDIVQSLVNDLQSPNSTVRANAAVAMGRLTREKVETSGLNRTVAALIVALHDSDADVARNAAASLGAIGDAAAVEPLIAAITNANGFFHNVVRAAASASLGQLHDIRALEPLMNAINDRSVEVSADAIQSVAAIADPRSVTALLGVVRNEHSFFLPTARRAAIQGLAKLGGPQADCELKFVAGNQFEDAMIRDAAIEANRKPAAHTAH